MLIHNKIPYFTVSSVINETGMTLEEAEALPRVLLVPPDYYDSEYYIVSDTTYDETDDVVRADISVRSIDIMGGTVPVLFSPYVNYLLFNDESIQVDVTFISHYDLAKRIVTDYINKQREKFIESTGSSSVEREWWSTKAAYAEKIKSSLDQGVPFVDINEVEIFKGELTVGGNEPTEQETIDLINKVLLKSRSYSLVGALLHGITKQAVDLIPTDINDANIVSELYTIVFEVTQPKITHIVNPKG